MAPILSRAGLTADADLVYRALVRFGQSRSAALAGDLSLSHGRVLTALASLLAAGLVSTKGEGTRRRWSAGAPKDQTPLLPRDLPGNHPAPTRTTGQLPGKSTYVPGPYPAQFQALTEVHPLGDDLRHLTSRPAAQRRLDELYRRGPRELLSIAPESSWDDAAMTAAARATHWMAHNGVFMRELGTQRLNPDFLVPYGGLRLPTDTYRRLTGAPMKLIIIDRRVAFFPVDPGNLERGYLEVSQAPIVESLAALFEKHWAEGKTDTDNLAEEPMSGFQLSPREEAVVEQLVLGHTDATAARALHISERTVSTIVRSLMERLDVRNRFQLGVALGRLDAAPLPPPAGRERGKDLNQRSGTGT
ncbi:MAG TPA: helix-turn-helix transcriptional regulator [Candidatus Limnocylindrales bacterium]|nr:helix-turn-helix transcriptional regulator [Candidatus Limnocylindrales bacterium]